jgi:hypothetical protein
MKTLNVRKHDTVAGKVKIRKTVRYKMGLVKHTRHKQAFAYSFLCKIAPDLFLLMLTKIYIYIVGKSRLPKNLKFP